MLKALNHSGSQIRASDTFRAHENGRERKNFFKKNFRLKKVLIIYNINLMVFIASAVDSVELSKPYNGGKQ